MLEFETLTKTQALQEKFTGIVSRLGVEEKRQRLTTLSQLREDPAFWNDQTEVKNVGQEIASLESTLKEITHIQDLFYDLSSMEELLKETPDQSLQSEYFSTQHTVDTILSNLEIQTFLSGKYDHRDAVLTIHAGQGGTEACDWASMVSRMYSRYFDLKEWKWELVDESRAEEGLKSVTYLVHGEFVYGLLKHETGAHRLVRLSPFNADNLRQTSFVGVDVLPLIAEEDKEIELNLDDLEWQFTRAGGHGGQNVNKVNSAVILKHIPTGMIVECRQERYQEQNKKTAVSILKSKLAALEEQAKSSEMAAIKGDYKVAGWGNQIRNYVLHPYHLVKDTRTKIETSDTQTVLDGDLDLFTQSCVRQL